MEPLSISQDETAVQKKDRTPLVSVILTTYNRADLLPRAIQSVLGQTFRDFELIIVDDESEDHTSDIVMQYQDKRIQYLRQMVNRGLAAARNKGNASSQAKFVAFLDDDDEWLETKLEKQITQLENTHKSVALTYCWMEYWSDGRVLSKRCPPLRGWIFDQVIERQPLGNASCWLLRREAVEKIGGFDESLRRGIDGDFLRRLSLKYRVEYVPEVLVKYHVNHYHRRITSEDKEGIRNAIQGEQIKFVKFKRELSRYPRKASYINQTIAAHYLKLQDWRGFFLFSIRAILANPFSVSSYVGLIRIFKSSLLKKADGFHK